jgi:5'-deoxynucleotidase YfbR-like HD superfamily hydrolase
MAQNYIDGTTYKIALDEDQLITLFHDRPESLIAHLVFGDPDQEEDSAAVEAAQREVVEHVVSLANLAPQMQALLVAIHDSAFGTPDRDRAIYDVMRFVAKIRGA